MDPRLAGVTDNDLDGESQAEWKWVRKRTEAACRLYGERLAAAAPALLVGILEGEAGVELVFHIVHLAAEQEHGGGGIDEDGDALLLDHVLEFLAVLGVFDDVGKAGAALLLDADA